MSLYISIIGIDGSGKSTLAAALTDLVPAELGATAVVVGEAISCRAPEQDLFLPGFMPDGELGVARLARAIRRGAKAAAGLRWLYPPLKLTHLALQELAARQIAGRCHPDVVFGDGSLLLSAIGRAANYASSAASLSPAEPDALTEALYTAVVENTPLPSSISDSLPCASFIRWLRRLDVRLRLGITDLPDAIIYLDIVPETALARRRATSRTLDPHENLSDMSQARAMYEGVVELFRRRRGSARIAVIDATELSLTQTLREAIDFLRPLLIHSRGGTGRAPGRLGAAAPQTSPHMIRHILANLSRGSAHELVFPLAGLGRLLLREGYSAEVMKAIYLQEMERYGLLDRVFLDYPLHRAVYHRLQILKHVVEGELRRRLNQLPTGRALRIMTAPSGYAADLFGPLARILRENPELGRQIHILASDLDPEGRIEPELVAAAGAADIGFEFLRGDLASREMRERFKRSGPFDLVLFVGLSSWISKPHLLGHLKHIRGNLLAPWGALISDCFTPGPYSLSGRSVGYKANYYSPRQFGNLLAYCGFDPAGITWESGPEGINHVCIARDAVPPVLCGIPAPVYDSADGPSEISRSREPRSNLYTAF